jgi:hypothetical protein
MNRELLAKIVADFRRHPITVAGPPDASEIEKLEHWVGFALPPEYKEFVSKFGAGIVGPFPIYGVGRAEVMSSSEASAIDQTVFFRSQGWPGTEKWLVISTDHSGNPMGLDAHGKVWISDHDFGGIDLLAESFEVFLRDVCLR